MGIKGVWTNGRLPMLHVLCAEKDASRFGRSYSLSSRLLRGWPKRRRRPWPRGIRRASGSSHVSRQVLTRTIQRDAFYSPAYVFYNNANYEIFVNFSKQWGWSKSTTDKLWFKQIFPLLLTSSILAEEKRKSAYLRFGRSSQSQLDEEVGKAEKRKSYYMRYLGFSSLFMHKRTLLDLESGPMRNLKALPTRLRLHHWRKRDL